MKAILSQLFSPGGREAAAAGRSGKQKAASPFGKLLNSILGKKNTRPVAYVRGGREVSFEKIPFIDKHGTPLKVETVGTEAGAKKIRVQRAGRLGKSNKVAADPALRRELQLSNNGGVSRAIPQFRKQVKAHLRETEELRLGILSGKIETPGNKDGRLKKKLKEESKNEDFAVDAAWLEQVKSHLSRSRGGDASSLRALAEAMNAAKKGSDDGKAESAVGRDGTIKAKGGGEEKVELADPTQPRVKKFKPQRIDSRTGLPVPEAPAEKGQKTAAGNGAGKIEKPTLQSAGHKQTIPVDASQARNGEVVERITFQRTEEKAAPLSESERRNQIVKALRQGNTAPEKSVNQQTAKPAADPAATKPKPAAAQDVKLPAGLAKEQSNTGKQESPQGRTFESAKQAKQVNPAKPDARPQSNERAAQQREAPVQNATQSTPKSTIAQPVDNGVEGMKARGWRMHTPGDLQPSGRARARSARPGAVPRGDDSRLGRTREGKQRTEPQGGRFGKAEATAARREVKVNAQATPQASNPVSQVSDNGAATSAKAPQVQQSAHPASSPMPQSSHTTQGGETHKALTNLQEVLTKLETNAKVLHGNGETRINVRLKPASLGSIAVQIHKKDGRYDVSMRAAHPEAARAIEQQLPMIREQLAQSGIQVEKFDIQSGAERSEDAHDQRTADREGQSGKGSSAEGQQGSSRSESASPEETAIPRRLNTGTNTVEYMG
ncbi:flagellar hook-length control protein FliK [bacterium]|nr:flagellar hook-length control protein FliK [bacterium]